MSKETPGLVQKSIQTVLWETSNSLHKPMPLELNANSSPVTGENND